MGIFKNWLLGSILLSTATCFAAEYSGLDKFGSDTLSVVNGFKDQSLQIASLDVVYATSMTVDLNVFDQASFAKMLSVQSRAVNSYFAQTNFEGYLFVRQEILLSKGRPKHLDPDVTKLLRKKCNKSKTQCVHTNVLDVAMFDINGHRVEVDNEFLTQYLIPLIEDSSMYTRLDELNLKNLKQSMVFSVPLYLGWGIRGVNAREFALQHDATQTNPKENIDLP